MEPLRREVLVPVPAHRRPASLIGLSIVMVLFASAVDALVWSFQVQRAAIERETRTVARPCHGARQHQPAPPTIRSAAHHRPEAMPRPVMPADE
jgi:hypothetical protein